MMTHQTYIVGGLIFGLILVGCGSQASNTSAPEDPNMIDGEQWPDITGNWLSPCVPQGDGTAFVLDFDISEARWELDYRIFADEGCQSSNVTVRIEGPYEIERASETVDGAYEATFGFDTKTITPHNEGMVGFLNSEGGCREGWIVDQAQSVFDEQGCAALGQYPSTMCTEDYDLVKLTDGKLMFGARPADNNMCAPEKRPEAMSGLELQQQ